MKIKIVKDEGYSFSAPLVGKTVNAKNYSGDAVLVSTEELAKALGDSEEAKYLSGNFKNDFTWAFRRENINVIDLDEGRM